MIVTNLHTGKKAVIADTQQAVTDWILDQLDFLAPEQVSLKFESVPKSQLYFKVTFGEHSASYMIQANNGGLHHTFATFSMAMPNEMVAAMIDFAIRNYWFEE